MHNLQINNSKNHNDIDSDVNQLSSMCINGSYSKQIQIINVADYQCINHRGNKINIGKQ